MASYMVARSAHSNNGTMPFDVVQVLFVRARQGYEIYSN